MRIRDGKDGTRELIIALAINAFFLAAMFIFFAPIYETNDDTLMSKFVDGQYFTKTAYIPYINICLGLLLKTLYSVLGSSVNWYAASQYALLFVSFTALTWVFLRRFPRYAALMLTVMLLSIMGTDVYLSMNFSKASGVGTVGGMTLLLHAMDAEKGKRLPLVIGFVTALFGFMWRFEEFGVCALIMAGACLIPTVEHLSDRAFRLGERIKKLLRCLLPVILLAAAAIALFAVNTLAWNRDGVKDYTSFDYSRSMLMDFKLPEYDEMPEAYDSVGMDESFVKMLKRWCFYDTEVFTQEALDTLIEQRDELVARSTPGECLGIFLNKCLSGFFLEKPVWLLTALLALWLACGGRKAGDWLALLYALGIFCVIYMLLIYSDRYLANRVDGSMFLALSMVTAFSLQSEKLGDEKLLCTALALLCLFTGYRYSRRLCVYDSHNRIEDRSRDKAAVEMILKDDEHLYFEKYRIHPEMYSPTETAPQGYAERIVPIGGWSMNHPQTKALLERNGITNPYRDLIDNESVYLIDYDIETTLKYLRSHYCPDAQAELIEPLSTQTGMMIYRIIK